MRGCFMASSSRTAGPVRWVVQNAVTRGITVPAARLQLQLFFVRPGALPPAFQSEDGWLDTEAPLTVIPYHVQTRLRWQPLGVQATWSGIPCDLGRIDVWLRAVHGLTFHGPFSLLAKFPRHDPPGKP